MPTDSNSFSKSSLQGRDDLVDCQHMYSQQTHGVAITHLWTSPLVASSIMMTTSAVLATAMTCRPLPLPTRLYIVVTFHGSFL